MVGIVVRHFRIIIIIIIQSGAVINYIMEAKLLTKKSSEGQCVCIRYSYGEDDKNDYDDQNGDAAGNDIPFLVFLPSIVLSFHPILFSLSVSFPSYRPSTLPLGRMLADAGT